MSADGFRFLVAAAALPRLTISIDEPSGAAVVEIRVEVLLTVPFFDVDDFFVLLPAAARAAASAFLRWLS